MAYGPPPSPGPQWQQPPNQPAPQWQGGQGAPQWQQPQQQPRHGQPPQQGFAPPQSPSPAPAEPLGPATLEERNWAVMAYIGQFAIALVAPAVVYLGKVRSPFVRRHAAQALNMGIASLAMWAVGLLLSMLWENLLWVPLVFTGVSLFFLVVAGRAANRGEFRRVPPPVAWPLLK